MSALLHQFPRSSVSYNICGSVYQSFDQMDASVEAYHKAIELNSDNARAHFSKVVVLHAAILAHFNQERHLCSRLNFKINHAATLVGWS